MGGFKFDVLIFSSKNDNLMFLIVLSFDKCVKSIYSLIFVKISSINYLRLFDYFQNFISVLIEKN